MTGQDERKSLPPTLSVGQAAGVLGISRRHAYYLANQGQIPSLRLGKTIRIPTHRLIALLDGKELA